MCMTPMPVILAQIAGSMAAEGYTPDTPEWHAEFARRVDLFKAEQAKRHEEFMREWEAARGDQACA